MNLSRDVLSDRDVDERLRGAIRTLGGRATESDMTVASGLAPHVLGPSLRRTMLAHECTIETTSDGDVVYVFDPALAEREDEPWRRWRAMRRYAWAGFRAFFKVAIAVVLVAYFVIIVALVIAAAVALLSARSSSSSSSSSGRSWSSGSSSSSGDFFLWAWIFGSSDYRHQRRQFRRHSYDDSWQNQATPLYESPRWATDGGHRSAKLRVPFHKKVFAFVFGREEEERDELFTEMQLLAYIRSAGGVVSPTELAARTGWSLRAAEKQSTRLIAEYSGDVDVTEDGQILYVFPELMATAGNATLGQTHPAPLIWEHYELPQPLTGNSGTANFAIGFLNATVLLGALVLIPGFAAPTLGIDMTAPAAYIGLYIVPAVYSILFFLVPIYRALMHVGPENRRRADRNSQRALLEQIYARSLPTARPFSLGTSDLRLPRDVKASIDSDEEIAESMQDLAIDYDAEGTVLDDGRVVYQFDRIADENRAADQARLLGGSLDVTRIGDRVTAQLKS